MPKRIDLIYNPFKQAAKLLIDQKEFCRPGSRFQKVIVGKPMENWLEMVTRSYLQWNGFLRELILEINENEFELFFTGDAESYMRFSEAVRRQEAELSGSGFELAPLEISHCMRFDLNQTLDSMRRLRKNWAVCVPTQKLLFARDRLDVRLEETMNREEMLVLVEDYIDLIRQMQRSVSEADRDAVSRMRIEWENLLGEECE